MLKVCMPQAKPGMVLAMAVYQPRRHGTVLLAPGVALDDQMIARLGENGVPGSASLRRRRPEIAGEVRPPPVAVPIPANGDQTRAWDRQRLG